VPLEKEKQNFEKFSCLTGRTPQPNPLAHIPATRTYWPHPSALAPSPHNFSPPRAPAPAPPLAASIPDKLALSPPLIELPGARRLGHTVCIATHCNACTAALCHHNAQSSPLAAKMVHYMSRAAWPRLPCTRRLARPSHAVGSCTSTAMMRRQAHGDKAPAPSCPSAYPCRSAQRSPLSPYLATIQPAQQASGLGTHMVCHTMCKLPRSRYLRKILYESSIVTC
jgi:hypothetical protein